MLLVWGAGAGTLSESGSLAMVIEEARAAIARRGDSPFGEPIDWNRATVIGYTKVFGRADRREGLGEVKWRAVTRQPSRVEYVTVAFDRSRVTLSDAIEDISIRPNVKRPSAKDLYLKFGVVFDRDSHWTARGLPSFYVEQMGGRGTEDLLFPIDKWISLVLAQRKPIFALVGFTDPKWEEQPIDVRDLEVVGILASRYYTVKQQHMCDDVGRPGTTFSVQDLKDVVKASPKKAGG